MKVLMLHRQHSAVGYYRTQLPARAIRELGHAAYCPPEPFWRALIPKNKSRGGSPVEQWFKEHLHEYDLLFVDRAIDWTDAGMFAGYRHHSDGMRMIVDFDDDFCNVPWWNPAERKFHPGQECREAGLGHLRLSEMVTVSTQPLADAFADKTHKIMVAPNHIDPADWQLPANPQRAKDDHLYILYGGASGHYGDLDEIREGLTPVLQNPPVPIRLVCFGSLPAWLHELSRELPEGRILTLPWVPFEDYPQTVAWGQFDLAIAPLSDHIFNEAKSSIKGLEAGIQKIPFLCSDIGPYQRDIPDGCAIKVSNTPAQWATALRELLTDATLRTRLRDRAYQWVMDTQTIQAQSYLDRWTEIVETASQLPRIESLEGTRLEPAAA